MKPLISALMLLCTLLHLSAFGQGRCGFDELHNRRMQIDPAYRESLKRTEKSISDYIERHKKDITSRMEDVSATLYTIPVVVHVVHTGGAVGTIYNPTDAQISGAIDYLNQVYNGTYPGTTGAGDLSIQFTLARKAPNCAATTGIVRVNGSGVANYTTGGVKSSPSSPTGTDEINIKNLSRWSPSDYYNIWVVNRIDGLDGTSGSFIAGYAYFPGIDKNLDGTVMLATQMIAGAKTLPHEIGHAFGLYHPFQGSSGSTCAANTDPNTQGDMVADTDPVTQPATFACRTGINACNSLAYSPNTEHNYMNYTNCYNLFTNGQRSRMLGAAASVYRMSLSTSPGLTSTGSGSSMASPVAASGAVPNTSATGRSGDYTGILNIRVNNRNYYSNATATDGGYVDGTANCINLLRLVRGTSYTFAGTVLGQNREQLRAWIDYNNDGVFDNATEQIFYVADIPNVREVTASANFTIPALVALNTTLRMRVINELSTSFGPGYTITGGTYNPVYGQAEDYPVMLSSGTLPLTLLDFKGRLQQNAALLEWTTSDEQNTKSFEVERSADGNSFHRIGTVAAAGNSAANLNYSFKDQQPGSVNYYRLKMMDLNGTSRYSKTVLIRHEAPAQRMWVLNNPVKDRIGVRFAKPVQLVQLRLVNMLGTVIFEKEFVKAGEQVQWYLPYEYFMSGVYILKAYADGEEFTEKVVKD